MECYYHPNKEGVNTCAICGKSVCEECSLEIAGKMYCKECLEKIVGIGLNNKTNEQKETQNIASQNVEKKSEPVRLGKKEEPQVYDESIYQPPKEEKAIFASDLSSNLDQSNENIYAGDLQEESSVYNTSPQQDSYPKEEVFNKPIADDSPYNIKGMSYSKEVNETPESYFRKESAPYLEPSNNINQDQSMGQNIIENQQQTLRQQPQSAQNEFDYYPQEQIAPQQQAPQDYIYPDHTYEPEETSARQALEEKYERYLDDLYFDETEVPLEEQLAKDEEEYGSLTKKPYVPQTPQPTEKEYNQQIIEEPAYVPQQMERQAYNPQANENQMYAQQQNYYQQEPQIRQPHRSYEEEQELDRQIRDQLNIRREQPKKSKKPIHNIRYEDEKEPFGIVDIILTIILIIAIIIVLFYIVYLFFLTNSYPTFLDAVFGLQDPGELIGNLMK